VFLAMSFMTHTFALTSALVAALTMAWARRSGGWHWGAISGAAVGMAIQIRPLEGMVLGGLLGLWALGPDPRRIRLPMLGGFTLGACALVGTVLVYNAALTGDPRTFPIMAYTDRLFGTNSNAIGFGPDRGINWPLDPFPGHGPADAVINANLNMFSLNVELFGWSIGSLGLVALFVLSGTMRRSDWLLAAVLAGTFIAHSCFWFSGGPDFGARYWYLMLVPLVGLAVRAIRYLEERAQAISGSPAAVAVPAAAVLALSALALVNYFPWRAIDKYHHYLHMRPDVLHLATEHGFGTSLVLVQGNEQDYTSSAVYNPLDWQADAPIYAWDRNANTTASVLETYHDRPVWVLQGPTLTGAGYRVIRGPVPAQQMLGERADR
jgi:hypothetical protein